MRKFALGKITGAVCLVLGVTACHRSSQTAHTTIREYDGRGIIRGIAPDYRAIDVEHETIPGFMPSMTMPFAVKDSKQITGFNIGDAISFRLTITDRDSWIDQIKKISRDELHLPAATATRSTIVSGSVRLREGDVMPPFQLDDQDGHSVTLETFRGHSFALTFIFTRCPIPNFCPLMSKNFAALQNAIKNGSGVVRQTRLLTISFDPDFDTPQILKIYAEHEQADPTIWTFATGDKKEINQLTRDFAVYVQPESGTISHGLATALIDENGRIKKIWRGNGWSPSEIVSEIRSGN